MYNVSTSTWKKVGKSCHMVKKAPHKEDSIAKRPPYGEKVAKRPPIIITKKIWGDFPGMGGGDHLLLPPPAGAHVPLPS